MKNETGFTLVEVLVALVLLGMIALMALAPLQNNRGFYQDNVGEELAEQKIEQYRNADFSTLANSTTTVVITTRGANTTYTVTATVTGFDVASVASNNTYSLNSLLVTPAPLAIPQVKTVTVQVAVGDNVLAQRSVTLHP